MAYYMLSVWKKSGKKSYSLCCATSNNVDDLLYDMTLYRIAEDEMYVISVCENGNTKNQGGRVASNCFYDKERKQITVDDSVDETIKSAINTVLHLQEG